MPAYEYRCPTCAFLFTSYRSVEDRDVLPACPRCSRPERLRTILMERTTSAGPVLFHGAGFTRTSTR